MRRHRTLVTALLVGLLAPAEARAALLTLRPDMPLVGTPGSTVGWGYTLAADSGRGIIGYEDVGATVGGSSVVSLLFDYPNVAPAATIWLDYDTVAGLGLVELALAAALSPGQSVSGVVFGKFLFTDESTEPFEVPFSVQVADGNIPEPSAPVLIIVGAATGFLWRRRRPNR